MKLFCKHVWSSWHSIRWTTTNFAGMTTDTTEHCGVIRGCIRCTKTQRREGRVWQWMLKDGEL